ncbi:hypothetical protein [Lactobacillus gasseri]|uniref:hypothetical protein n=1 Tax=Lactobacillus gasseri TaxID=1596 RepID=UPI0036F48A2C
MRIMDITGYSRETAEQYIDRNKPIYSISSKLETMYKWVDGKPTSEVKGYKAWFSQEGLPPFTVKFEFEFKLPEYMSLVEFDSLKGCKIRNNVYFRADGLKKVK